MIINSKQDWIELARKIIPYIPEYMAEESGQVQPSMVEAELNKLLEIEDWNMLHKRFEEIWNWLPDRPSIRRYPFFDICDLCSEYWVFEDNNGDIK